MWLIHISTITYLYVWHASTMCAAWLRYMRDMAHTSVWHHSFVCATRHIPMCAVTHLDMFHDSFLCVSRLRKCDETHSRTHTTLHFSVSRSLYKRFTSPINGLGLKWIHKTTTKPAAVVSHISMSHMTHINESWHIQDVTLATSASAFLFGEIRQSDSGGARWQRGCKPPVSVCRVTHIDESSHTYQRVMSPIWMSYVTHKAIHKSLQYYCHFMNSSCHTYQCNTSHISTRHVEGINTTYKTQNLEASSITHTHTTLKPPVSMSEGINTTYKTQNLEASSIYDI